MNFLPNREQIQKIIRALLTGVGAGIVGAVASKTGVSAEQITTLLSSEAVIGFLMFGGTLIWSLISGKTNNQIAAVAAMEEVKKIETTPAVAKAIPDPIVVAAPAAKLTQTEKKGG